jgi:hypothetical protein
MTTYTRTHPLTNINYSHSDRQTKQEEQIHEGGKVNSSHTCINWLRKTVSNKSESNYRKVDLSWKDSSVMGEGK